MKKYRFRLIISVFIYLFFKITSSDCIECLFIWDLAASVYLVYTISVVLITWEIIARVIKYFNRKSVITSNSDFFRISLKAGLIILPFVILFSFVSYGIISPLVHESTTPNDFWAMSAQGFVLTQLIILYEIIRIYIRHAVNDAKEKEQIKKELFAAKYEGLKNQVNPHFLFNSFSVLSSLVEKDSEAAVDFIAKLSDMYRYILENDEKSLVTLEDEMNFLDDYLFLLKIRHQSSLIIEKDIEGVDMSASIPPMSLQILVENAVKHNSFSKEEPLKITINSLDRKSIQVKNKKVEKVELTKSTGIGLSNLSKRLKLLTGKGLTIIEDEVLFKVSVPLT